MQKITGDKGVMESQVKVSCIMPTHNRSDLLVRALDSLMAQSLKEIEIIVVDDASTDDTPDIIKQRMQLDHRLHVVRNDENSGPAQSQNIGYGLAKGEYVIFLDSDDYFLHSMLEKAYTLANLYHSDLVVFDRILADNNQMPDIQKGIDQIHIALYEKGNRNAYITKLRNVPWNKLVAKKLLDEYCIQFQDLPAGNDIFYSYAVSLAASRTLITNEPLLVYFSNSDANISASAKAASCNEVFAFQKVFAFMQNIKVEEQIIVEMTDHAVRCITENANNRIRKFGRCDMNEKIASAKVFQEYIKSVAQRYPVHKQTRYFAAKLESGSDMLKNGQYRNYGKLAAVLCEIAGRIGIKIALWGCGKIGTEILYYMEEENCRVDYVIDQNEEKQGKNILGYTICSFHDIGTEVDVILVSTHKFIAEILELAKNKVVIDLCSYIQKM